MEENPEKGRELIKSCGLGEICKSKFERKKVNIQLKKRDLNGEPLLISKGHQLLGHKAKRCWELYL